MRGRVAGEDGVDRALDALSPRWRSTRGRDAAVQAGGARRAVGTAAGTGAAGPRTRRAPRPAHRDRRAGRPATTRSSCGEWLPRTAPPRRCRRVHESIVRMRERERAEPRRGRRQDWLVTPRRRARPAGPARQPRRPLRSARDVRRRAGTAAARLSDRHRRHRRRHAACEPLARAWAAATARTLVARAAGGCRPRHHPPHPAWRAQRRAAPRPRQVAGISLLSHGDHEEIEGHDRRRRPSTFVIFVSRLRALRGDGRYLTSSVRSATGLPSIRISTV